MLLLELGHVDDGHVLLAAIEQVGQRQRRLGLADAARCRPSGTRRSACAGRSGRRARCGSPARSRPARGPGRRRAPSAWSLQLQHGVDLVGDHPADRDAGPGGDDLGDRLAIDHREAPAAPRPAASAARPRPRPSSVFSASVSTGSAGLPSGPGIGTAAASIWWRRSRIFATSAFSSSQRFISSASSAATLRVLLLERDAPRLVVRRRSLPRARSRRARCRSASRRRWRSSTGAGIAAWLMRDAGAGGVEQRHALVGQLPRRDVARRELHRLGRPPRRGCARRGASRASRPGRAASRSASGSVGSSTFTTWKRRVSAASFSKYFLYSAQVVAAMLRSSPRASAGFSRLAASFCPACAAGADQRVRLVDEQDDRRRRRLHLVDDALEAVLELALHAGAGLQQAQVERHGASRPSAHRGTSPAAMRSARPSTTAVLPTPASPVRIGLFWRRRVRMSTIWRISASRPRIGSILPALACADELGAELVERPARARRLAGRRAARRAAAGGVRSRPRRLPRCPRPSRRGSAAPHRPAGSAATARFPCTVRASVSSFSSAASRWPERIFGAPDSRLSRAARPRAAR